MNGKAAKTAHTPGPWKLKRSANDEIIGVILGSDDNLVATTGYRVVPGECEDDANARLIAASPRMYDYIEKRAAEGDTEAASILEGIHAAR